MMSTILTEQIREEIYYSLSSRRLFSEEEKGCLAGSRGTAELVYIDQIILNESKTRQKILAMDWLQKGIWNGPAKLNNKPLQNIHNITWSH